MTSDDERHKRAERNADHMRSELQAALQRLTNAEQEIGALKKKVIEQQQHLERHDDQFEDDAERFEQVIARIDEIAGMMRGDELAHAATGGRDEQPS